MTTNSESRKLPSLLDSVKPGSRRQIRIPEMKTDSKKTKTSSISSKESSSSAIRLPRTKREREISSLRIPLVRSAKSSMIESCDLPRTIGTGRTKMCKDGTIRDSRFPSTSRPSRSFRSAMMEGPKTVSYSRTKRTLPDEEYGQPGLEVFMSFGSQSPNVGDFLSCIRSRDIQNRFTPCPGAKKKPTLEEYEYYLSIYDSNMSYFRQEISLGKNKSATISKVNTWFSCIAEPCPETDDEDDIRQWQEREEKRISTGISAYWDPSILGESEPETE